MEKKKRKTKRKIRDKKIKRKRRENNTSHEITCLSNAWALDQSGNLQDLDHAS